MKMSLKNYFPERLTNLIFYLCDEMGIGSERLIKSSREVLMTYGALRLFCDVIEPPHSSTYSHPNQPIFFYFHAPF